MMKLNFRKGILISVTFAISLILGKWIHVFVETIAFEEGESNREYIRQYSLDYQNPNTYMESSDSYSLPITNFDNEINFDKSIKIKEEDKKTKLPSEDGEILETEKIYTKYASGVITESNNGDFYEWNGWNTPNSVAIEVGNEICIRLYNSGGTPEIVENPEFSSSNSSIVYGRAYHYWSQTAGDACAVVFEGRAIGNATVTVRNGSQSKSFDVTILPPPGWYIGNTYYAALADAVNAATASDVIKASGDFTDGTGDDVEISGKTVKIDMGTSTVTFTRSIHVYSGARLDINGNGKLKTNSNWRLINNNGGTVNVGNEGNCNVELESTSAEAEAIILNSGTFTFNGKGIYSKRYGIYNNTLGWTQVGHFTLTKGTIDISTTTEDTTYGIWNQGSGTLNINGGTIKVSCVGDPNRRGVINVGTANITGGTIYADCPLSNEQEYSIMNISGGNFYAGTSASNITGYEALHNFGKAYISGGTFKGKDRGILNEGGTWTGNGTQYDTIAELRISGDTNIIATSGIGIQNSAKLYLYQGTVKGSTWGLYQLNTSDFSQTVVGQSGDAVVQSTPLVIGDDYGFYVDNTNLHNGTLQFYDGKFCGKNGAAIYARVGEIETIVPAGYAVVTDQETISGTLYNTAYLGDAVIRGSVSITGTLTHGQTLTATLGSVTPTGCDYAYQWYYNTSNSTSNGTLINGATASTLVLDDTTYIGKYIYVVVSATKDGYEPAQFEAITSGKIQPLSFSPVLTMSDYTYGGPLPTPSVSPNPGNGTVTYYYHTTNTTTGGDVWNSTSGLTLGARGYYMHAEIAASGSYAEAKTGAVAFTVNAATPIITLVDKVTPYTGQPITIDPATKEGVNGETPAGTLSYTYYTKDTATAADRTTSDNGASEIGGPPSKKGVYYVRATFTATPGGNYENSLSELAMLTIGSKNIADLVILINPAEYVYDGLEKRPNVGIYDSSVIVVEFDANGGTCDIATKAVSTGGLYGTLPTAERTGFEFDGWRFTNQQTDNTAVTENTAVTKTENHKLYAHWTEKAPEIHNSAKLCRYGTSTCPNSERCEDFTFVKRVPVSGFSHTHAYSYWQNGSRIFVSGRECTSTSGYFSVYRCNDCSYCALLFECASCAYFNGIDHEVIEILGTQNRSVYEPYYTLGRWYWYSESWNVTQSGITINYILHHATSCTSCNQGKIDTLCSTHNYTGQHYYCTSCEYVGPTKKHTAQ